MRIIYCLLFNLIYVKLCLAYLIFPFKTRFPQIPEIDKNITALFRSIVDNHIFIGLDIGTPKQTIEVFLRSDTTDFYISDKNKNDEKTSNPSPYIYDVGSDLNKFFDKHESTSLEITKEVINNNIYPGGILIGNVSFDNLYFINNKKETSNAKTKFILYQSTFGYMPGVIGLGAVLEQEEKEYNLIEQLKTNDIINSYFWMINYTSDYEGNFIIGEQPHIIDPEYFKKDKLSFSYPFLYDDFYDWGLAFDSITFNGINLKQFHDSTFNYELNYIKGSLELEKQLDIYFNNFILNGTCFKETIKYPYSPNIFFYCDKNLYKNNIKYFPPLKFYQYEFNFTFELNYKDLFIEKNNKYILMVFFDDKKFDWYFGKPFLRKYSFSMNQDTKIIGFYKQPENNNDSNNNKNKKDNLIFGTKSTIILFISLTICVIILLLLSGIFLGRYIYRNKKTKKNVLEEDFDYTAKKDEGIINE